MHRSAKSNPSRKKFSESLCIRRLWISCFLSLHNPYTYLIHDRGSRANLLRESALFSLFRALFKLNGVYLVLCGSKKFLELSSFSCRYPRRTKRRSRALHNQRWVGFGFESENRYTWSFIRGIFAIDYCAGQWFQTNYGYINIVGFHVCLNLNMATFSSCWK